jgi:DNA-binding MarR family transcriptional regulator
MTKRPDRDALDDNLEIWAREIPDLDPLTEGIIERIQILAWNVNQSLDETLAEFELDRRSFGLLGKLRKHGPPYRVPAGKLADDLRLSSGAMTNRLDRMEAAGLVRRVPDPTDRRAILVEPTELGHARWDRTVGAQARREALFSSVLSGPEKERLHDLLRHMMLAFPNWKHKKQAAQEAETGEAPAP